MNKVVFTVWDNIIFFFYIISLAKTIYIKSFDKSFVKHIIHNNNDLRNLLRKFYGKGLEPIKEDAGNYCEYPTLIRSFQGIRNNEFYRVDLSEFFLRNKFSERVNWKQIEDKVTEDESFSAVRNEIQIPTLLYDRIITDASGITKIEWDGTFYDHKRLFLCEAKHNMSEVRIFILKSFCKLLNEWFLLISFAFLETFD